MKDSKTSALGRGLSVVWKLFVGTRKGPSGERVRQLKKLQRLIGVKFNDLGLLEQALTHRSYSHVTSQTRNQSNERMEFLGDSVLGLAVSQFLYLQFPDRSEGALSKMKSLLVSRKVLSTVSRDCGLGEFLLLSGEESEMGGRDRSSILADSFEGVIGAIYLDQGFRAANKFIQTFLLGQIHEILKDEEHTNFKSLLQEYVQSRRLSHPVYRVRREEGPEHEKEFAIEVVVKGEVWGVGRGKSKKDAEQNAARAALERRQAKDGGRPPRRQEPEPRDTEAESRRGGDRQRAERGERPERPDRTRRDVLPTGPPRDRGEHGILASREKLRQSRREEEEERRRMEAETRERREERLRTAESERSAPGDSRSGEGRPDVRQDREGRPGGRGEWRRGRDRREGRGGRRGEARPARDGDRDRRGGRSRWTPPGEIPTLPEEAPETAGECEVPVAAVGAEPAPAVGEPEPPVPPQVAAPPPAFPGGAGDAPDAVSAASLAPAAIAAGRPPDAPSFGRRARYRRGPEQARPVEAGPAPGGETRAVEEPAPAAPVHEARDVVADVPVGPGPSRGQPPVPFGTPLASVDSAEGVPVYAAGEAGEGDPEHDAEGAPTGPGDGSHAFERRKRRHGRGLRRR